jgi:hypothetical protein
MVESPNALFIGPEKSVVDQFAETVNHKGHEGTRRNTLTPKAFVILRVLGG